jgi:hypothetical protein
MRVFWKVLLKVTVPAERNKIGPSIITRLFALFAIALLADSTLISGCYAMKLSKK